MVWAVGIVLMIGVNGIWHWVVLCCVVAIIVDVVVGDVCCYGRS